MDYYQGYEDAMRQARVTRSTGLLGFFSRTLISILYSAFVYAPLLLIGYVITDAISALYSNDAYIKVGLTFLVSYLLFAGIYFLKGLVIGLRLKGHASWLFLFILCVAMTSGVQAVGTQMFLSDFFAARSVLNFELWSWLGAGIVALLIYSHYQFLTNVSPRTVFWTYKLGVGAINHYAKKPARDNTIAKKSESYLGNSKMRVTFKR